MHSTKKFIPILLLGLIFSACNTEQSPGYEYMPDMYRTPHIKAFEENAMFENGLSALHPAEGTIPRGFATYEQFPNTPAGYDSAKASLEMPSDLMVDAKNLEDGAKLYGIFCTQCHGDAGDGQGVLVKNEKFLGVPSYADRDINFGSIFYVQTYGKGVMGSHAAQLTPTERWKVAMHVLELRKALVGEDAPEEAEASEEMAEEMAMNNAE